jgi:hypothetical protein
VNKSVLKSRTLSPPEAWLEEWIQPLLAAHPEIEQVYLLGDRARGPQGQKPDYSLLFYAGYDNALELMMALAREEEERRTNDGILHLYVENYGATFCGIWGGALIPNNLNSDWREGTDFLLWIERGSRARPLSERLRLPLERRFGDRRRRAEAAEPAEPVEPTRDDLTPTFTGALDNNERRRTDRRRDVAQLVPLLED